MISNKILADAILQLAGAIHEINMNARSRSIAAHVEGFVRSAVIEEAAQEIKEWREIASSLSKLGDLFTGTLIAAGSKVAMPQTDRRDDKKANETTGDAMHHKGQDGLVQSTIAAFNSSAAAVTAAAEKRFAANPFAPTFEVLPGESEITIRLYPRPGSVQYLVNVTGPDSSGVKFEAALPKIVHVAAVVESPHE